MSHALSAEVLSRLAEDEPNIVIEVESGKNSLENTHQPCLNLPATSKTDDSSASSGQEFSQNQSDAPPIPPPLPVPVHSIPPLE